MRHIVTAIRASMAQKNWLAALTLAVSAPDVCCSLAPSELKRPAAYAAWFDRYVREYYTFKRTKIRSRYEELSAASQKSPHSPMNLYEIFLRTRDRPDVRTEELIASITGEECYALRCKLLHSGLDTISPSARDHVFAKFMFVEPRPGFVVHNNHLQLANQPTQLQLQVDVFCESICLGVLAWLSENEGDDQVQSGIKRLITIETLHTDDRD